MCFTPCLSIISWNISPPVIPMKLTYVSYFGTLVIGGEHTIRPYPAAACFVRVAPHFCVVLCYRLDLVSLLLVCIFRRLDVDCDSYLMNKDIGGQRTLRVLPLSTVFSSMMIPVVSMLLLLRRATKWQSVGCVVRFCGLPLWQHARAIEAWWW